LRLDKALRWIRIDAVRPFSRPRQHIPIFYLFITKIMETSRDFGFSLPSEDVRGSKKKSAGSAPPENAGRTAKKGLGHREGKAIRRRK
jgi:hypothetical protein